MNALGTHRVGRVVSFDEHRGTGEIAADDGTVLPFHCTVIADGSRRITVGEAVVFGVAPGHLGRWEAVAVEPAPEPHRG